MFGPRFCLFLEVGSGGVAAFDDFVVVERLVELLHFGGEFARVDGADPVVFGGGEDEGLGVVDVGLQLVVGRDGGQERALFGDGDGAVFADPGGAGGDVLEAEHVEQRDLDDDGVPHLRVLGELDAHQQAAVGAALDAEAARAR